MGTMWLPFHDWEEHKAINDNNEIQIKASLKAELQMAKYSKYSSNNNNSISDKFKWQGAQWVIRIGQVTLVCLHIVTLFVVQGV